MGAREATAFTILPILLAAIIWLPPWVFLATVWAIAVLAAWELLAILRRLGHPVPLLPSLVGAGIAMPILWYGGLPWAGAILACHVLAAPIVYLLGRFPLAGASAGITGATGGRAGDAGGVIRESKTDGASGGRAASGS